MGLRLANRLVRLSPQVILMCGPYDRDLYSIAAVKRGAGSVPHLLSVSKAKFYNRGDKRLLIYEAVLSTPYFDGTALFHHAQTPALPSSKRRPASLDFSNAGGASGLQSEKIVVRQRFLHDSR